VLEALSEALLAHMEAAAHRDMEGVMCKLPHVTPYSNMYVMLR
jgi:hypothetical protein